MTVFAVLFFVFGVNITGCGDRSTVPSSSGQPGTQVRNIVQYVSNSPDKIFIKELVNDFEDIHKDIKVEVIAVPFDEYDSKLQTMISGGTPPDVATHLGWSGFMEYYNKGVLTELDKYMSLYNFDAESIGIPNEMMDIWKVDNKQYGIPINAYISLMLYNKDMFDEVGLPYPPTDYKDLSWTWDKMIDYAKQLTIESDDISKVRYGLMWDWSAGGREQDPTYFGHNVFPEDTWTNGFASENYFNEPNIVDSLQRLADLTWKDKVAPPHAFTQGIAGGNPFLSGKVGMQVGGGWILSGVNDVEFNVGVAAIPVAGNPNVRNVLWIDPFWIIKGTDHPDAAFEWIMYLAQQEIQEQIIALSGGNPPANVKALPYYAGFFEGIDPEDLYEVYNGGIEYGEEGYSHMMVGAGQINTLISNELSPLFNGDKNAADVAPVLQQKLNELLKQISEEHKK